jgi:DNA-directed RNA polymerase subunit RPC12/RpoP
MAVLEHDVDVGIVCRCVACRTEADIDRLERANAKISREMKVDGRTVFELEVEDPMAACRCGSRRFTFRWSWG